MERINELEFYKKIFLKFKEKKTFFIFSDYKKKEKLKKIFHNEKIIFLKEININNLENEYKKIITANNILNFNNITIIYDNSLNETSEKNQNNLKRNIKNKISFLNFLKKKGANIIFLIKNENKLSFVLNLFSNEENEFILVNDNKIVSENKIYETLFRLENKNRLKFYTYEDTIDKILNPFPLVLENKGTFYQKLKLLKEKLSEDYIFRKSYSIDNEKINLPIYKIIVTNNENKSIFLKKLNDFFKISKFESIKKSFENYKNIKTIENFSEIFPIKFINYIENKDYRNFIPINDFQDFNKKFENIIFDQKFENIIKYFSKKYIISNLNYDQKFKIYNALLKSQKDIKERKHIEIELHYLVIYLVDFLIFLEKQNYISNFNLLIIENYKKENIEFLILDIFLTNLGIDYIIFENSDLKEELKKINNIENEFNIL